MSPDPPPLQQAVQPQNFCTTLDYSPLNMGRVAPQRTNTTAIFVAQAMPVITASVAPFEPLPLLVAQTVGIIKIIGPLHGLAVPIS